MGRTEGMARHVVGPLAGVRLHVLPRRLDRRVCVVPTNRHRVRASATTIAVDTQRSKTEGQGGVGSHSEIHEHGFGCMLLRVLPDEPHGFPAERVACRCRCKAV